MATKAVLKTVERDERLGSSTLPSSAKQQGDSWKNSVLNVVKQSY